MYKSLYDIQIQHASLVEELIECDGEVSAELEMALAINEDELTEKAEAYALRILDFEGQSAVIDAEIKRLQKRKQSFEKTAERLKETIKAAMIQFNKDKIKTERVTLSFRKSEVIEVPEFWLDDVLKFFTLKAEFNKEKFDTAIETAYQEDAPLPLKPNEELLQYLKLSASVDKAKMKAVMKEGNVIDESIMLLPKQNLQIK